MPFNCVNCYRQSAKNVPISFTDGSPKTFLSVNYKDCLYFAIVILEKSHVLFYFFI